jgi:hypothetical protein
MAAPSRGQKPAPAQVVPTGPIHTIFALDPGVRDLGLARFSRSSDPSGWSLSSARWIRAEAEPARCTRCHAACDHASRPLQIGKMVDEVLLGALELAPSALLVCEWPVVYQQQKAPAADLLDIAGVVGGVMTGAYVRGAFIWRVLPREWKGTHKKEIHQTWILASLEEKERALVPRTPLKDYYVSDALDAVGLGLWAAGRSTTWRCPPQQFIDRVEPVLTRNARRARPQVLPLFLRGK